MFNIGMIRDIVPSPGLNMKRVVISTSDHANPGVARLEFLQGPSGVTKGHSLCPNKHREKSTILPSQWAGLLPSAAECFRVPDLGNPGLFFDRFPGG